MTRFFTLIVAVGLTLVFLTSCQRTPESGDRDALNGYRFLHEERYSEAAEAFETALKKGLSEQEYDVVYTCLGNAYNELEEYAKSIAFHKKAIDVNPEFHKSWVNLGIVYRLTGDFAEAEKCYTKALELAPEYAELHASIGALYIFQEKYHQAVQHLEKATALDKHLPVAWGNLSLAYATVGEFDKADSTLKRAVILGYKNGPILRKRIDDLKATTDKP